MFSKDCLNDHQLTLIERVAKHGLDDLKQTDALEVLLIEYDPSLDTRDLALRLIKKFSSFSRVLKTPIYELIKTRGVNYELAFYLHTTHQSARYFLDKLNNRSARVYSSAIALKYLAPKFVGRTKEALGVLLLNSKGKIVFDDIIWQGSVGQVPVYIRDLLELCVRYDVSTVFIAHNHPSGNPSPSRGDLASTREIQLALDSIYVFLEDHFIIVDGGDSTSMRKAGWMVDINTQINQFRTDMLMDAKRIDDENNFEP